MQCRQGIAILVAMATVHMSEAELARDLHNVLAKVQQGVEVIIEQDQRPVSRCSSRRNPAGQAAECALI